MQTASESLALSFTSKNNNGGRSVFGLGDNQVCHMVQWCQDKRSPRLRNKDGGARSNAKPVTYIPGLSMPATGKCALEIQASMADQSSSSKEPFARSSLNVSHKYCFSDALKPTCVPWCWIKDCLLLFLCELPEGCCGRVLYPTHTGTHVLNAFMENGDSADKKTLELNRDCEKQQLIPEQTPTTHATDRANIDSTCN